MKARLADLAGFHPHGEEPSVLVPDSPGLIEVNLLGIDPGASIGDAYVIEDEVLPLMVYGALALVRAGDPVVIAGLSIPVPRVAGLVLEKLLTDRAGEKGDRDLLVVREDRQRRVRRARSRAAVRRWEYRQRNLAKGVWFRLRRLLADAREAYSIPDQAATVLASEGYREEPAGAELEPPRRIFFVPEERLSRIGGRRQLAVRLDVELLRSPALALVRFPLPPDGDPKLRI